ncbi:4-alpha-glucanotransferase [soil metagenome]
MNLQARAKAAGVELGYQDHSGVFRTSPEASLLKVLDAIEEGAPPGYEERGPLVLRRGARLPFDDPALVDTDTGEEMAVEGTIPDHMPFGYHTIRGPDEVPRRLIVSPGGCFLPENLRTWGWAAQLYALRSANSWGMGDLGDLEELARWSASEGAGLIMINPLGAATPGRSVEPSPYYPSSRSFRSPLYLPVDRLAGDAALIDTFREAGRALNAAPLINRDAVWAAKGPALELLFREFDGHPEFDLYCEDQGGSLDDFAIFCALAEQYEGPCWDWPEGVRHPGTAEVSEFRSEYYSRVSFHKWLQWHLEGQLAMAGRHLGLVKDLPVGVDPSGADAWIWGDAFARGFALGAPPDEFNRAGQVWGIAGFHPKRLKAAGYEPFIRMIRSALSQAGGMRIDHVMGLFRLFWIPDGCDASEGVYVRYPAGELLDIVALESQRARAFVVGEDLGTVEPNVRDEMAARSILSYRLLIFEEGAESIPQNSMAAVTTHDLPTLAGIWGGADLRSQSALDVAVNDEGMEEMRHRLRRAAGAPSEESVSRVMPAVYERLAQSPARIVLATLEDAVGSTDRPNMPGISEGWPNWKIALNKTLEELKGLPLTTELTTALRTAGRDDRTDLAPASDPVHQQGQ